MSFGLFNDGNLLKKNFTGIFLHLNSHLEIDTIILAFLEHKISQKRNVMYLCQK